MKSKGNFVFKGLEEKSGGEFINEKGQTIKYEGSQLVKFDEQIGSIIYDRKIKVSNKELALIEKMKNIKPYTPVEMEFDVNFYANGVQLKLINIEKM